MNKFLLLAFCIVFIVACGQEDDPYQAFDKGDYKTAYAGFYKLAKQENMAAVNYLGVMNYLGLGRKRDVLAARKWFEQAAENGFAGAQFNLGNIYENGEGVPQDFVTAYKWFYIAREFGHERAEDRMRQLLSRRKIFPNQAGHATDLALKFIATSEANALKIEK